MSSPRFKGSRLKIERAKKHLSDFHQLFVTFSNSDAYTVKVEEDLEERTHALRFDINMAAFNSLEDTASLIVGDVLHNLRSSLDHLYYQLILASGGTPTKWSTFPFKDSGEELERQIIEILKQKRIRAEISDIILNNIKPYPTGNPTLCALHDMNIRDKHEKFIEMLKLMGFFDVCLEDERGNPVGRRNYLAEESCVIPLTGTYGRKITLKDKGRPSANIIFNVGAPGFQGETVFPSLVRVTEEVTRTVNAFEEIHFP